MCTLTCKKQNLTQSTNIVHGNVSIKVMPWYHVEFSPQAVSPCSNEYIHISITPKRQNHNKTNRIHQHAFALRVGHRQKKGAIFPGSNGKVGAPCQIPSNCFLLLQPLLLLLLLLCLLQLSCCTPSFSSIISPTALATSSQRAGAKLPPFPGSKGHVDAPYRAEHPCSSDSGLVTAGSSPCLLYTSPSPRDLSTSRMPSSA